MSMDFKIYSEIYHYGVIGMHWGIRRYQPYPKDYTGDGREYGEARKVQRRLIRQANLNAHGAVMGDRNKAYSQYLEKDPDFHKAVEKYNNQKDKVNKYFLEVQKSVNAGKKESHSNLLKEYTDSYNEFKSHMDKAVDKWLGSAGDLDYKLKGKDTQKLKNYISDQIRKEMKMHRLKSIIDDDMKVNPGSDINSYYITNSSMQGLHFVRYYDRVNGYDAIVRDKDGNPRML